ncbi:MAG: hypothetical protein HXY40_06260 [Chloroflexi bacterium]|nr:hypothetical protein [Chloroflexota bacterium]
MNNESLPPEAQTPRSERRGRARERHLKRKGGRPQSESAQAFTPRAPTTPRSSLPRAARQLSPSGRFKLPEIKLPQSRVPLLIVAGLIFVIVGVFVLGEIRNRAPEAGPNALWVSSDWTYTRHEDGEIAAFAQRLRDNQIGTVYAWVSYLTPEARWADNQNGRFDNVRDDVQAFTVQFKRAYPEVRLLAWIGLPFGADPDTYNQDSEAFLRLVLNFSQQAVTQLGFDGIFLQVEQVGNGDENFMTLLRQIGAQFDEEVVLAVAVPPDWTPTNAGITLPPLYAPGTVWERSYKQRVALLADQMVVMAYNSGFENAEDYSQWVAYQTSTFAETVAELEGGAQIVVGVSTAEAEAPRHDPAVENIASAVAGIEAGLAESAEAAATVRGIALYGSWTTSDDEWAQFRDTWLNR